MKLLLQRFYYIYRTGEDVIVIDEETEEIEAESSSVLTESDIIEEVRPRPVGVEPAPVERSDGESPVEPDGVSPVESDGESPVEPVQESPVEPVQESPVEPVEESPVEPVEESQVEPVQESPVEPEFAYSSYSGSSSSA